ncbi:MAG: asparagine synthase (glutamine-hydrolyzing) [Rhodospirillaceae bacterium]|jgi:asparagine synthase (glutamine-hydrolysing)
MCAVSGLIHFGRSDRIDRDILDRMNQTMVHRGPDGGDVYISPDGLTGLAHRRLSIIDLTDSADQPMTNEDGTLWISYNGEIYNHAGLRPELEAAGHVFASDHSDTEVLIHGYEEWGIRGLLDRLEGMFVFAIWDQARRRMTIARDRIGIKPVYFTKRGGMFAFASEIKALLAHPNIPASVSGTALYHYLTYLTTPAPLTMFDGIYKLPAAHYLEVAAGGKLSAARYWDAMPDQDISPDELNGLSPAEIEKFYRDGVVQRLEASVEKRMMSDAPYGAFLSGGIDSSVNVALMDRFTDDPVNTFTVGFKDHQHLNELEHARRVAELYKTNHHEILIDEADMAGYLQDLVHQQDEPLADWVCIPLHFVSKLAHDNGVKVIQVGEGSDEQFCGYNGYMKYLELHERYFGPFRKLPGPLRSLGAGLASGLAKLAPKFEIYADAVGRAAENREAFWSGAVAYWEAQKRALLPGFSSASPTGWEEMAEIGLLPESYLRPDSFYVAQHFLHDIDSAHPGRDQLTRMIYNEFRLRLPELLLMRVDKITMASSLESRVPFLDHHLVEFTMDIPQSAKISGGVQKQLLKKAVEGIIPDDIIYRKKMGFAAPMAQWLEGEFGRQAEADILSSPLLDQLRFDKAHISTLIGDHRSGRRDTSLLVWVLCNLTAWHRHWIG